MAHSQGRKQYLRKNPALLYISKTTACLPCKFPLGTNNFVPILEGVYKERPSFLPELSSFLFFSLQWERCLRSGGGLPFPHWLARRAIVGCSSSPGLDSFSFVCFWNFHGIFDQNSLRREKADPIFIHRNAANRLHLVWVPQSTSAFLQHHVLWETPYLSLHSSTSCTGFTTVFCANLSPLWDHKLLAPGDGVTSFFCGLQVCVCAWAERMLADGFMESEMPLVYLGLLSYDQGSRSCVEPWNSTARLCVHFVFVNETLWQIAKLNRPIVVTSGRKSIIIPI